MSGSANRFIDKRYLSELHRQYLNDETIRRLTDEKVKVVQHSNIRMDNRGNIVPDKNSEQLLFYIDQLIEDHKQTYYSELFK